MIKSTLPIAALAAGLILGCGSESNETNTPEGNNPPSGGSNPGTTPPAPQSTSESPLYKAAERGDLEAMKKLIADKADLNALGGDDGESPLHRAITRRQTEAAKLLIDSGADVNIARKKDGQTPLAMAEKRGHTDIAAMLKAKGAK